MSEREGFETSNARKACCHLSATPGIKMDRTTGVKRNRQGSLAFGRWRSFAEGQVRSTFPNARRQQASGSRHHRNHHV
jgi:hypothetical protein